MDRNLSWWEITELVDSVDLLNNAPDDDIPTMTVAAQAPASFTGSVEQMLHEVGSLVRDGWTVLALTNGRGSTDRLIELFRESISGEDPIPAIRRETLDGGTEGALQPGVVEVCETPASAGFFNS